MQYHVWGPSNPMDPGAIIGTAEHDMINERAWDETNLMPKVAEGSLERQYNQGMLTFCKSLDTIDIWTN